MYHGIQKNYLPVYPLRRGHHNMYWIHQSFLLNLKQSIHGRIGSSKSDIIRVSRLGSRIIHYLGVTLVLLGRILVAPVQDRFAGGGGWFCAGWAASVAGSSKTGWVAFRSNTCWDCKPTKLAGTPGADCSIGGIEAAMNAVLPFGRGFLIFGLN